jgi:glutaredoxin
MKRTLVMYTRTMGCPFVTTAKRVLAEHGVPYREVYIDRDPQAKQRLMLWVGFQSVPTMIAVDGDAVTPYEDPSPLERGASPRGINRGSMITEPNIEQFETWLRQHGFIG